MKSTILIAGLALMVLLPFIAPAQEPAQNTEAQPIPIYKPPLRGAPASRIGGASRGGPDQALVLRALVPDHTGLTINPQPVLYWYLSEAASTRLELTLIHDESIQPLLEITLDTPSVAGIQRLSLSDYNVSLQPDKEYQWFVALVPDVEQRTGDIITGGAIRRIPTDAQLKTTLEQFDTRQHPGLYAKAGLWYDAIEAISKLIDAAPEDNTLRVHRAALLEQAGLEKVAADDR